MRDRHYKKPFNYSLRRITHVVSSPGGDRHRERHSRPPCRAPRATPRSRTYYRRAQSNHFGVSTQRVPDTIHDRLCTNPKVPTNRQGPFIDVVVRRSSFADPTPPQQTPVTQRSYSQALRHSRHSPLNAPYTVHNEASPELARHGYHRKLRSFGRRPRTLRSAAEISTESSFHVFHSPAIDPRYPLLTLPHFRQITETESPRDPRSGPPRRGAPSRERAAEKRIAMSSLRLDHANNLVPRTFNQQTGS